MKKFIKFIIALITLALGCILGIYLLDGFVLWKMTIFLLACYGIGHGVYFLLRVIDKKFSDAD